MGTHNSQVLCLGHGDQFSNVIPLLQAGSWTLQVIYRRQIMHVQRAAALCCKIACNFWESS
jgi:hypothetical protein